jgi:uncharacterized membrane protein
MAAGKKTAGEHALERLVFFSDAVFAIAITLLVLELHAPELPHGVSDMDQWHALAALIPSFFGFALSFFVIGRFWLSHHQAFSLAQKYDERLLTPNLWLLMAIVFLPFVTAYLSGNVGERVPTLVYNISFVVAALLNYRLTRIATAPPVLPPDNAVDAVGALKDRSLGIVFGAATALVASLFDPVFGQSALVTMAIWPRLLAWRRKRAMASANATAHSNATN